MESIKNAKCEKNWELRWELMPLSKESTGISPEKNPRFTEQKTASVRYLQAMKLLTGMLTTEELGPLSVPLPHSSVKHP